MSHLDTPDETYLAGNVTVNVYNKAYSTMYAVRLSAPFIADQELSPRTAEGAAFDRRLRKAIRKTNRRVNKLATTMGLA